jgi:hypothetical protein
MPFSEATFSTKMNGCTEEQATLLTQIHKLVYLVHTILLPSRTEVAVSQVEVQSATAVHAALWAPNLCGGGLIDVITDHSVLKQLEQTVPAHVLERPSSGVSQSSSGMQGSDNVH